MKWFADECLPGDIIRIQFSAFYHYGIYISDDEVIQFGPAPVHGFARNEAEIRVEVTDIDGFASGIIPEKGHPDRADEKRRLPAEKCIEAARAAVGEGGYSLLHNNCEHFANRCYFGESRSETTDIIRDRWQKMFGKKEDK